VRSHPRIRSSRRRAFTLIELLLATTLSAILMGAVLIVSASLARDARRINARPVVSPLGGCVDILRRDLVNARSITRRDDGRSLILIGHGGISPRTRESTGRLARVSYTVIATDDARTPALVRRQEYLDDPVDRQPWQELLATGVTAIDAVSADGTTVLKDESLALGRPPGRPQSAGAAPATITIQMPSRVSLRIEAQNAPGSIVQEIWTR
jgi:prepilin-type N-terminal cleavage/methylation domain-containing protein